MSEVGDEQTEGPGGGPPVPVDGPGDGPSGPVDGPGDGPSVPAQQRYAAHECQVSVTRSHSEGSRRDGRCTWCHRRFEGPAREPRLARGYLTEAERAYRYVYDPDWGLDPRDV